MGGPNGDPPPDDSDDGDSSKTDDEEDDSSDDESEEGDPHLTKRGRSKSRPRKGDGGPPNPRAQQKGQNRRSPLET